MLQNKKSPVVRFYLVFSLIFACVWALTMFFYSKYMQSPVVKIKMKTAKVEIFATGTILTPKIVPKR